MFYRNLTRLGPGEWECLEELLAEAECDERPAERVWLEELPDGELVPLVNGGGGTVDDG